MIKGCSFQKSLFMSGLWFQDKGSLPLLFSTLGVDQAGEACHVPLANTKYFYSILFYALYLGYYIWDITNPESFFSSWNSTL